MKKIILLISFVFVLSCIKKEDATNLPPNIVLIMADDLGYGDIQPYGSTTIHTPNLEFLASEGIKFTDFHSNGAVCSPTRAALMTGKYQQRTGVEGVITAKSHRDVGLNLNEITIAEELKKHGYNCGMFGKWHLGYSKEYNPTLQGFDDYTGFVSGNIDYHAHIDQEGYLDWWKGTKIENEEGYSTDLITQYGVKYIEKNNPKNTAKPFFLYLPHEAPHGPYQRRIDSILRTVGKAGTKPISKNSIPSVYKEMVEVMDEGIGKIIQVLKETKQYENTIIVFLSDNGANRFGSNGVLKGHKGGVYEGGSRVPAIFSYPDKVKKGMINNQIVLTMDLLPTFLDFIDQKPSSTHIDGISIKENLIHQTNLPERDVFFAYGNNSFVRSGDWKLVYKKNKNGDKIELYNLSNDLQETNDVSLINPDLVKKLSNKLQLWKKEVKAGVRLVSK
ncbi:sulfatase-like hydrolase/transferase [Jejuia spongiicola]|uniref:Sulfatase-like hydrolase/transferase n=1 Tax=Jejuia spongiicola TaxID=2942207 RepID=A0ABT0QHZ9_9FLAO|nr:sulfatase-like hydrolase/transferase [Jejuia spongiicola]MCL6295570.1 sulfatase-like hydrolase/transferase [Jejuia spongiicola]